ncbi:hypothetical protein [Cytobacillus sp. Bac17]|uniref:hypothetical protein n=1 Tax=Cytobacillus sp. Bac17 TaxID=2926008 RepID=UPI002118B076|nr:hypothetical protein [Cytobacillus sp. Bac17]
MNLIYFSVFSWMQQRVKKLSKQIANKDLEQYRYVKTKRTLEEVEAEFNVTMNEGVLLQYMINLGIPFGSIIPENPQTSPFHFKIVFLHML